MRQTYWNPKLMIIVSTVVAVLLFGSLPKLYAFQSISKTRYPYFGLKSKKIISKRNHDRLAAQGLDSTDMFDGFLTNSDIIVTAPCSDVSSNLSPLYQYSSSMLVADIDFLDIIKNLGIGIFAFALVTLGLLYLFANVIIPQASAELERQVRELYPDLWAEYEAKLQPGETLATRPDLIQELGTELRKLQLAEFERQASAAATAAAAASKSQDDAVDGINSSTKANSVIIDAEVVKSDDREK